MILHPLLDASLEEQLRDIDSHSGSFAGPVSYHCYWNGDIGWPQLASLASCYRRCVEGTDSKIVLWTVGIEDSPGLEAASRFCEIRIFSEGVARGTVLEGWDPNRLGIPSFYSDYVRYAALLSEGGMWFDLDVMFYRSMEPLMAAYPAFVHSWGRCRYPNGAVYWAGDRKPVEDMASLLMEHGGRHMGFQDSFSERGDRQALLEYGAKADLHVLPCGWFDPDWISGDPHRSFFEEGRPHQDRGYCYHWHGNSVAANLREGSPFWKEAKALGERYSISIV